ncbi:hypothetical protein BROOK1789C_1266 [Bathymodiolus brooksi thiotrophic gill symbiont]|nr:hypothetical protein BROOK1789C_1266 [Bathymodiolus brooksi thiotrophic gill symbiont]
MFSLILKLLPNKAKIYALRVKITKDKNNKATLSRQMTLVNNLY